MDKVFSGSVFTASEEIIFTMAASYLHPLIKSRGINNIDSYLMEGDSSWDKQLCSLYRSF